MMVNDEVVLSRLSEVDASYSAPQYNVSFRLVSSKEGGGFNYKTIDPRDFVEKEQVDLLFPESMNKRECDNGRFYATMYHAGRVFPVNKSNVTILVTGALSGINLALENLQEQNKSLSGLINKLKKNIEPVTIKDEGEFFTLRDLYLSKPKLLSGNSGITGEQFESLLNNEVKLFEAILADTVLNSYRHRGTKSAEYWLENNDKALNLGRTYFNDDSNGRNRKKSDNHLHIQLWKKQLPIPFDKPKDKKIYDEFIGELRSLLESFYKNQVRGLQEAVANAQENYLIYAAKKIFSCNIEDLKKDPTKLNDAHLCSYLFLFEELAVSAKMFKGEHKNAYMCYPLSSSQTNESIFSALRLYLNNQVNVNLIDIQISETTPVTNPRDVRGTLFNPAGSRNNSPLISPTASSTNLREHVVESSSPPSDSELDRLFALAEQQGSLIQRLTSLKERKQGNVPLAQSRVLVTGATGKSSGMY